MSRVIRVGGVEEAFNLPWLLAAETGAFSHLDVDVTFTNFAGGTGALVRGLEDDQIDLATLLTEGAVTAIANGSAVRLHSQFVESPLLWGIHVAQGSSAQAVDDLEGQRFAISRFGSGSELMAYVLAEQNGWRLQHENFVVVGGIDGALEALPAGDAEIFLWERFVTAPHVGADQPFRRVDDMPSPWPSFYTATRPGLLNTDRELVTGIVRVVLAEAARLVADPERAAAEIVLRYGMSQEDTESWLTDVRWPSAEGIDAEVLTSVMETMASLGRIDAPVGVEALTS